MRMRIVLLYSLQQRWGSMRLGSANNHIFHILDAYTHIYYVPFFIALEMQIPWLEEAWAYLLCEVNSHVKMVEQGKKDVTSHFMFEVLLQHPPHPISCGLVSYSIMDGELTTSQRSWSHWWAALSWEKQPFILSNLPASGVPTLTLVQRLASSALR